MVLAIAALFVHLHAAAAVSKPVSTVTASATQSAGADDSKTSTLISNSEPASSYRVLASNTGPASTSFDGQTSPISPLSASSFAAVVHGSESLSEIRVATPDSKALKFVEAKSLPSRRRWLALATAEHAAAAFDAYSTRLAINAGAVEADPLMRPFAQSPAIYAAIQVAPVALDFAARRMQHSDNGFLRRTWWLPQSAATGMFLFSGVHNLHVANQLH